MTTDWVCAAIGSCIDVVVVVPCVGGIIIVGSCVGIGGVIAAGSYAGIDGITAVGSCTNEFETSAVVGTCAT